MTNRISERFTWAVEVLNVESDDTLLEIGCGHGITLSLICDKLIEGTITAIDRSEKMTKMATRRNSEHIATGKLDLHTLALKDAHLGNKQFNKIFAINVNIFWQEPAHELPVIRQLLRTDGVLYLFYQPPSADMAQSTARTVQSKLKSASFKIVDVLVQEKSSNVLLCIMATAP